MNEQKVISFPSRRPHRKPEGDGALANDVQKAWRAFWRKVTAARAAGLTVEIECVDEMIKQAPRIVRELR